MTLPLEWRGSSCGLVRVLVCLTAKAMVGLCLDRLWAGFGQLLGRVPEIRFQQVSGAVGSRYQNIRHAENVSQVSVLARR